MGCGSSAAKNTPALLPPQEGEEPAVKAETNETSNEDKNGKVPVDSDTTNKDAIDADGVPDTIDDIESKTPNRGPTTSSFEKSTENKQPATIQPGFPSIQKPSSIHAEPPPQDWVAADRVAEPPPQDWVAADRVAESCPVPPGATTSDLVDFFKRCDLSGALLARAIFRWITLNIGQAQPSHEASELPDVVMKTGLAKDGGYAALFAELCSLCSLTAHLVEGYVKEQNYIPGSNPAATSQVFNYWNVLELEEGTFCVDCCRAAGVIKDGKFQRLFDDFYWLPSPSEVIYTHYTEVAEFQACTKHLSLEDWIALPKTSPAYHRNRCAMESELQSSFRADSESLLQIHFTVPKHFTCKSQIIRLEPKQKLPQSYSYVYQDGNKCTLYSGYPHSGQYLLRLLGRSKDAPTEKEVEELVEVSVFVEKGRGPEVLYPVVLNFYKEFLLFGPLIGQLVRDMPAYFHCKVLGASQVSIIVGEHTVPLKKISDDRDELNAAERSKRRMLNSSKDHETDDANHAKNAVENDQEAALEEAATALAMAAIVAATHGGECCHGNAESYSHTDVKPPITDPGDSLTTILVTPASPNIISVPDSEVTTVWAGEALISAKEVFLAAFYTENIGFVKLVKFSSRLI